MGHALACHRRSSLAIGYLAIQWKPKQLQLNQMVVWDLDWSSKTIRGRAWFHLYSGNQERYDVEANTRPIGMVAPSSIPVVSIGLACPAMAWEDLIRRSLRTAVCPSIA